MFNYPHNLQKLINEISKFPGVGPKMAERIGLFIMKQESGYIENLGSAISGIKEIGFCAKCFNVSEKNLCSICSNDSLGEEVLCVVESPEDVIMVEKTGKHIGYYHILQGLINPLNNVLPENLRIKELVDRTGEKELKEIILAINHTVEGDATSLYILNMVKEKNKGIRITRLAKGLPTGSDIKYADEITLGQAILERKEI